ncbi:MAG TPA: HupE/UreJ family protein, partial [Vicinamibacterales bacterium]|nr:HupE/UreJ family protein [Vicinamibacterales bacterium]
NDPNWLLLRLERFAGCGSGELPATSPNNRQCVGARDARLAAMAPVFIDRTVLFVAHHEVRPSSVEYLPPRPQLDSDNLPPLASYRLRGRMPRDADSLRWYYGLVIDPYLLTVHRGDGRTVADTVGGEEWSRPIDLMAQPEKRAWLPLAVQSISLGFGRVLPRGVDYILFVVGLMLLQVKRRPIVLQLAVFTLATTIALGLTAYGAPLLPSRTIESLTAVSVAFVALENLRTSQIKPWRLALVFVFGLLFGARFGSAVAYLDVPRSQLPFALATVACGIEAGQLAIVGATVLAVTWYRQQAWFHARVVVPASMAIAAMGMYWTFARAIG